MISDTTVEGIRAGRIVGNCELYSNLFSLSDYLGIGSCNFVNYKIMITPRISKGDSYDVSSGSCNISCGISEVK